VKAEDLCQAVLEALRSYIRSNGRRLLAMIDAIGQEEVLISASALYSYYRPRPGLERLESALDALRKLGVEELVGGVRLAEGEPPNLRVRRAFIRRVLTEEESER